MIRVDLNSCKSFIPLPYEAALAPRLRIAHNHLQKNDGAGGAAARISTVSMRAATMMVVTIPIVLVYPFFQKYFVKGISIGAVKG
mgnify:CR=1 FL=1